MILYVSGTFGKLGNLQLLQAAYQKYFLMLHLQFDLTRKGYSVNDLDLRVAQDIIGIEQHPICRNGEIHELFICYINIYKLEVPCDLEDAITFSVKVLECLERDGCQI